MNLYEIDAAIMDCVDEETGEIIAPEMLDELEMARDTKIEQIALYIKNLGAEAEAIKKEKLALANRQSVTEKKAEGLKNYLSNYMAGAKFKSPRVAISWRKSEAVEVDDVYALPEEFLRFKEPEINKTDLKAALQLGTEIPGVRLVQRQNIQIR